VVRLPEPDGRRVEEEERASSPWSSSPLSPTLLPQFRAMFLSHLLFSALSLASLASAHGYITSHKARMVSPFEIQSASKA
jgi:hypothetical protein